MREGDGTGRGKVNRREFAKYEEEEGKRSRERYTHINLHCMSTNVPVCAHKSACPLHLRPTFKQKRALTSVQTT